MSKIQRQLKSLKATQFISTRKQQSRIIQQEKYKSMVGRMTNIISIENLMRKQKNPYEVYDYQSSGIFEYKAMQTNKLLIKKEIRPHKVVSSNSLISQIRSNQQSIIIQPRNAKYSSNNLFGPIVRFQDNQNTSWKNPSVLSKEIIKTIQGRLVKLNAQQIKIQCKKVQIAKKSSKKIKNQQKVIFEEPQQQKGQENSAQDGAFCQGEVQFSCKEKNNAKFIRQVNKETNYTNFINISLKNYPTKKQTNNQQLKKTHFPQRRVKYRNSAFDYSFPSDLQCNEDTLAFFEAEDELIRQEYLQVNLQKSSAKAVSVLHIDNQVIRYIYEQQANQKSQIASITKVMTCLLALKIAEKFNINIEQQKVFTSEKAAKTQGTSAQLQYSDSASLFYMLHGLMLPSGNDAAVAIAEWGGKTIRKYCRLAKKYRQIKSSSEKDYIRAKAPQKKSFIKLFISFMNKSAKILQLQDTYFANVHGLINSKSYSTASNISRLAHISLKNQRFRKIVSQKTFSCRIFNRTFSQFREEKWKNTNKLLEINGFQGIKTGITPTAGPCLVSSFKVTNKQQIIITVLKSKCMERRFQDTLEILSEILLKLQQISDKNKQNLYKRALIKIQNAKGLKLVEQQNENTNNIQQVEDQNQVQSLNDSFG